MPTETHDSSLENVGVCAIAPFLKHGLYIYCTHRRKVSSRLVSGYLALLMVVDFWCRFSVDAASQLPPLPEAASLYRHILYSELYEAA